MGQYEFTVGGMPCTGCGERVTNAVKRVEGVRRVDTDHETGTVEVTADENTEANVYQASHNAGYDPA